MEFVFVVPRTKLFPESYPHGLSFFGPESPQEAFQTCVETHGFFVERDHAERTPSLKQVIPYSLVVRGGEILCLRRTKRGGEARLHDKLSIGVGGHINPVDLPAEGRRRSNPERRDPIAAATHREVAEEELRIAGPYRVQRVGLLNDDSNPVGAVHVGLVQVIAVDGPVEVREVDQLEGSFVTRGELRAMLEAGANFESWSSLLVPHVDRLVSEPIVTPS